MTASLAREDRRPQLPRFAFPVVDLVLGMRDARVLSIADETPTIRSIRLEPPVGYAFRAGQHASLRLQTEAGPDMRQLSISSSPAEGVLEFATRRGPSAFKRAYFDLHPGDTVKVSRAMGDWTIDESEPAVLVAGGIGVTPVKSVLSDALGSLRHPVRLVLANHSRSEIPFASAFSDMAQGDLVAVVHQLTDLSEGSPVGGAFEGRIDRTAVEREVASADPRAVFYVTGPDGFVTSVVALLRECGVAAARIRSLSKS